MDMRSNGGKHRWRIMVAVLAPIIFATLVAGGMGAASAQQYEFNRFRNTLIDYFKGQNYLPVLVNRGYTVGDVINVDGVNFYARALRCFPKLLAPVLAKKSFAGKIFR